MLSETKSVIAIFCMARLTITIFALSQYELTSYNMTPGQRTYTNATQHVSDHLERCAVLISSSSVELEIHCVGSHDHLIAAQPSLCQS